MMEANANLGMWRHNVLNILKPMFLGYNQVNEGTSLFLHLCSEWIKSREMQSIYEG